MVREREKEESKCSMKSTTAPKKTEKKIKREGKRNKKVFTVPKTVAKGEPEGDTEGWAPDLRPSFFKILHPLQSKERLHIPPHFMKHLRNDTSNRATLKCSSGRFWNIELRPAIGSMYLQDGWQQFLEDNSLGDGEFLLFRYDGSMCFNVQIFEKSGCERVGMSVPEKHQEFTVPEVKRKRGRPRKNPLSPPPSKSCGDGPGQSHLQPQQEKFEEVKEEKGILRKIKDEERTDLSFQEDSHNRPCSLERSPPAEEVEEEEDTVGFERVAKSFSSGFPYFQSQLKRASVDKVFVLHIPASFSKAHLDQNIKTRIALRNLQGETWEVKCIQSGREHFLWGGWAAFVRGNNLKRGDICIFELVGRNELRVNIFRM